MLSFLPSYRYSGIGLPIAVALANVLLPYCILVQYGYVETFSMFTMVSGSQKEGEYMVRYHRSVDWLGQ